MPARRPKRPLRDNTRLILAGIALLLAVLVGLVALANRTPQFTPDFLTEFVLYALSAADLTMLVALVFVLARNIVKLVVERRRGLPFARFRAKLVALLLGMTLVPTIIVLMVGSELIRTNIDRWFNRRWRKFSIRRRRSPATTTRNGRRWSATTRRAWRGGSPTST